MEQVHMVIMVDQRSGGGGGAGGLIYWDSMPLSNETYPVTVGDGGPAATGSSGNGGNSVFGPGTPVHLVALGGGAAGAGVRNHKPTQKVEDLEEVVVDFLVAPTLHLELKQQV